MLYAIITNDTRLAYLPMDVVARIPPAFTSAIAASAQESFDGLLSIWYQTIASVSRLPVNSSMSLTKEIFYLASKKDQDTAKPTKLYVHPAKIPIRLSSLASTRRSIGMNGPIDQTVWVCRVI